MQTKARSRAAFAGVFGGHQLERTSRAPRAFSLANEYAQREVKPNASRPAQSIRRSETASATNLASQSGDVPLRKHDADKDARKHSPIFPQNFGRANRSFKV